MSERNSIVEKISFEIDEKRIDLIAADVNGTILAYCERNGYERDISMTPYFDVYRCYDDCDIGVKFARFETDEEIETRKKYEKQAILKDKEKHEKELAKLEKLAAKLGKRVS